MGNTKKTRTVSSLILKFLLSEEKEMRADMPTNTMMIMISRKTQPIKYRERFSNKPMQ
jgi:hypothetical protein